MANTDNFIIVALDENTFTVTDDLFECTAYVFTRGRSGGSYNGNLTITIDPLANNATKLAAIKSQVAAYLNTANLGRTFSAVNVAVWGQFA